MLKKLRQLLPLLIGQLIFPSAGPGVADVVVVKQGDPVAAVAGASDVRLALGALAESLGNRAARVNVGLRIDPLDVILIDLDIQIFRDPPDLQTRVAHHLLVANEECAAVVIERCLEDFEADGYSLDGRVKSIAPEDDVGCHAVARIAERADRLRPPGTNPLQRDGADFVHLDNHRAGAGID